MYINILEIPPITELHDAFTITVYSETAGSDTCRFISHGLTWGTIYGRVTIMEVGHYGYYQHSAS